MSSRLFREMTKHTKGRIHLYTSPNKITSSREPNEYNFWITVYIKIIYLKFIIYQIQQLYEVIVTKFI